MSNLIHVLIYPLLLTINHSAKQIEKLGMKLACWPRGKWGNKQREGNGIVLIRYV